MEPSTETLPNYLDNPAEFVARYTGNNVPREPSACRAAFEALQRDVLPAFLAESTDERCAALAQILESVALKFHTYGRTGWAERLFLKFGPLAIPASPEGLRTLQALRGYAERTVGSELAESAAEGSPLRYMLDSLKSALRSNASAYHGALVNATRHNGQGFALELRFPNFGATLRALPKGEALPPSLLAPELEGFEVTDALDAIGELGFCADGSAEFLDKFGIGYTRENGESECQSCGCISESSDSGDLESVEDFTITADMIRFWDRAHKLDEIREHISGSAAWDLSELLESGTDAEILERFKPSGMSYDPAQWEFLPDFESVEGLSDLDFPTMVRALPLLAELAKNWHAAGFLPPIAGRLNPKGWAVDSTTRRGDWIWTPDVGTLEHDMGSGNVLRFNVARQDFTYLTPDGRTVSAETDGQRATFTLRAGGNAGGEALGRALGILQGSAEL